MALSKEFEKKNLDDEKVSTYFNEIAEEFDSIYEDRGTLQTRIVNKLFRKGMFERVQITIEELRPLQGKSVLDIGCGSGRVAFLLAKEGARVTGIDYAGNMIELAKEYQQSSSVSGFTEFICADFMRNFTEDKKFDFAILLGVFDYIEDPVPFMKKVMRITSNKIIAYYPAKFNLQSPLRKIWLSTRNCPVFFFTQRELKQMYLKLGLGKVEYIPVPQKAIFPAGYVVVSQIQ